MKPTLVSISYSPWSLKARWALDASGVAYEKTEYQPVFGELALRARLRRFRGRVSVPVLLVDGRAIEDSFNIAQWGAGASGHLFPPDQLAEIRRWNERSETLLSLGRERTTALVKGDPEALLENVPPPLRKLGPVTRGIGRFGVWFLQSKYEMSNVDTAAHVARMREILLELRDALEAGGGNLVAGQLTYADITMAVGLQFISPHERIRLGRKSRAHWTVDALVREFADIIEWRDRLWATW